MELTDYICFARQSFRMRFPLYVREQLIREYPEEINQEVLAMALDAQAQGMSGREAGTYFQREWYRFAHDAGWKHTSFGGRKKTGQGWQRVVGTQLRYVPYQRHRHKAVYHTLGMATTPC